MSRQPHDVPIEATAENGQVMLDGPGGLALSMTPAAANISAKALTRAAAQAEKQARSGAGDGTSN